MALHISCTVLFVALLVVIYTAIVGVFVEVRLRRMSAALGSDKHANRKWDESSSGAPNSATGISFGGEKLRSFTGKRRLRGAANRNYPHVDLGTKFNASQCDRWGVVTTIFDPTDAVARVARLPSWCMAIVADRKTPAGYMAKLRRLVEEGGGSKRLSLNNVAYLSVEQQRKWQNIIGPFGAFVRSTPWNHFCRKNLGYLLAIMHGAEFIFDFDDDNFIRLDGNGLPVDILPPGKRSKMTLPNVSIAMLGPHAFNHHPMMEASVEDSWPRGFPISMIRDKSTRGEVAFESELSFAGDKEIGVVQFLADGDPDIDATHRMTRPLPMSFAGTKSVLAPVHSYSPYNAQATIHTKSAFWAALLPGTVPGRVSDIWRSYFAECIFGDAQLRLVFSPPIVSQERNAHDYRGDFNAEHDLYEKAGTLIEYLSEWDSAGDNVPERMEELWIDMYERGYIDMDDVHSVQLWLETLIQVDYQFPPLKRRHRNVAVMGQFNYADRESTLHDVIFWTQKHREHFHTVMAAGPFSPSQMKALKEMSITAMSGENDAGYHSPLKNLKKALLIFENSTTIDGVLYAHDDGLMNITELTLGSYPFPVDKLIRTGSMDEKHRDFGYRAFPDGHTESLNKSLSFESLDEMFEVYPFPSVWHHFSAPYCARGQMKLAKDPASEIYRETDGSLLFPAFEQSDFAFVPTKYADEFIAAAELHLKHGVWIDWGGARGNPRDMAQLCSRSDEAVGLAHPLKISRGYDQFSEAFDQLQTAPLTCNPIQAAAQCTAGARNLGRLSSPEECAAKMTNAPECGGTFMFSSSYPDWGCHCCKHGDVINDSGNKNWALYSAHRAPYPTLGH